MTRWSPLVTALEPVFERVRRDVHWERNAGEHPSARKTPLTRRHLQHHVNGGPFCGASAIAPGGSTTLIALLDLDSHKGETSWSDLADTAAAIAGELAGRGLNAVPFRSSGGHGIHLYLLWDEAQDARTVREELKNVLAACGLTPGVGGVAKGEVEIFPKQDSVPEDGFGSMFILPLADKSVPLDEMMTPQDKAAPIQWVTSRPLPKLPPVERVQKSLEEIVGFDEVKELLSRIPNDDLDYDQWRNVIFAIHSATDGEGIELAREWSAQSGKHDDTFFEERVWPYIRDRDDGITIGTLRAMARDVANPEDFDDLGEPPVSAIMDFEDLGPAEEKPKQRYLVQALSEFAVMPRVSWLIKHVLPVGDVVVMFGPPASGKSFMAIDMALALSHGWDWRGYKTKKCRVAYVAAEGANGVRKRFIAAAKAMNLDLSQIDIDVIAAAPNLLEIKDAKDLARALKAAGTYDLIIIDTLAQTMAGGNENSGEDVGKVLAHCKGISRATGATIMLIHHAGKDTTKGARGWSGLRGAVDAEFEVLRADEDRVLSVSKQKDGEDGQEFGFKLKVVTIGTDEDGEDVTSCVVEHTNQTAASVRKRSKPLGPNELALVQCHDDLALLDGKGVGVDDLVAAALVKRGFEDNHNTRRNMRRSLSNVVGTGRLIENNGVILAPEGGDEE